MSSQVQAIPYILTGVLLNALAQIPLKKGLQAAGGLTLSKGILPVVMIFFQPWVILGIACYVLSLVVWLAALSKSDVGFAYPFLALGFLAQAVLGWIFLGEGVPPLRWVALALIVTGVALQAFTDRPHGKAPVEGRK